MSFIKGPFSMPKIRSSPSDFLLPIRYELLQKSPESWSYMSVVVGILYIQARETKSEVPKIKIKKLRIDLTNSFLSCIMVITKQTKQLAHYKEAR
jgi:hypothetical protein